MIDPRLELRLRTDPTGDPIHQVGQVHLRMAAAAGIRVRSRPDVVRLPVPSLLGAILLVVLVLLLGPLAIGPLTPPPPTPTPAPTVTTAPLATISSTQLGQVVTDWAARIGGDPAPISVTLIGPAGGATSFTTGALPGNPPVASSARLGEISRVYVAAGIAVIDDCSTVSSSFSCRKGVFPTTMRIDDAVARWYPDWPVTDTTTVRQLLEGSSGLAPVATDLADLAAQLTANPGTDWSRRAALARAIAAPRRFTAGARIEPVDAEWLLLEAIIERASGKSSSLVIPTEAMAEPFDTTFVDQPPIALMAGRRADGSAIADLDPKLLELLGNAGGMAAPSADLAEYALTAWATTETLNDPIVNLLTDAADGHALPLGAEGLCPCDGSTRFVIRQIGHAVGWSTILAYDFQTRVAVGVAIGADVTSTDLDTLLQSVIAISR